MVANLLSGAGIMPGGVKFNPAKDIGDLSGKVIFVTGGNVGLGRETIRQLAKHNPKKIYLAARSEEKANIAIQELVSENPTILRNKLLEFIQCDLADLSSVQACARTFLSKEQRLDILFCNAGVMALPEGTTKQGYEMQFGTNHVGHALLLKLLLPTLQSTSQLPGADVRVIMLSSVGHNAAGGKLPFAQLKGTMKEHNTLARYGFSKLANLVWAQQLSKRYPSITAVALHPGMVDSNLYATFTGQGVFSKLFGAVKAVGKCILPGVWLTVEEGAKNQLWAATATKGEGKGEVQAGKYYDPVGRPGTRFVDDATKDDKLGSELWEWTDEELAGWEL